LYYLFLGKILSSLFEEVTNNTQKNGINRLNKKESGPFIRKRIALKHSKECPLSSMSFASDIFEEDAISLRPVEYYNKTNFEKMNPNVKSVCN